MTTLVKPPPLIKTNQENKPLFTLHTQPNHIMAWSPATTSKMAVVSFRREEDITQLARMIEAHYDAEHEWPDFKELRFVASSRHRGALRKLGIFEWSNQDMLRSFCAHHYFDLIVVNTITNKNINGNIFSLSVPEKYHVPYLDQLIQKTEQPPEN